MFLAFSIVRLKHSWSFETGNVDILRGIDAALYMESELMSSILNRFPWDVVYQDSRTTGFALNVLGSVFWREASKTSNKMYQVVPERSLYLFSLLVEGCYFVFFHDIDYWNCTILSTFKVYVVGQSRCWSRMGSNPFQPSEYKRKLH